jgi:hypothetical protein
MLESLIAICSVEYVFSIMKVVKNRVYNKMSDQLLNDCLVTFIERYILGTINNDVILVYFQKIDSKQFLL